MTQTEFQSVLDAGKLPNNIDWKVPILFHVPKDREGQIKEGVEVNLCDEAGYIVAIMEVTSCFEIDLKAYCSAVMGTNNMAHPGVSGIMKQSRQCIGGPVKLSVSAIANQPFEKTPSEIRDLLKDSNATRFTAFSTRNISHRGHEYQHQIAFEKNGFLGVHVITGAALAGSFLPDIVLDTYQMLAREIYSDERVLINNIRLPPIYAGPKEAFLQATVLQNMGFTQFIVGRDHAGVGDYYGRYASQEIFVQDSSLDIKILALPEPQYCSHCNDIVTENTCQKPHDLKKLNGRDVRRLLVDKDYISLNEILRPEVRDMIIARHSAGPIFVEG